ncbi:ribonuclease H [Candidatus Roizmanbacteria bacterium CG_4_9_14_0_2_um_filter_39_13]|uniref:Ribonuclease H n=2 Tax=Candidatus Roizmaniibacteriota TaxID=1752723 RepID=A0A2M8EYI5_9BACT|nr:MAG: ribonuclease H [Candidatus Roizmanbacteria bacterium CG_4_9_14_0_2_um_filter_39_13]PJE61955.1 MAG: ribonuclease H [Candidatus Roizmanbacteria bacterium CG10_big_fil_rev_8_21_14_0_10_39_12]
MNLTIYTDGGSLNNPGQAAYGFLIYDGKKQVYTQNERIGIASNNVAEYTALIRALEFVRDTIQKSKVSAKGLLIISDSLLMVNQVNGLYKVKNVDIKPLHSKIKMLEMELGLPISYKHVLRDKNTEADALVKEALGK